MSELDLDIRAVANASFGARAVATDVGQNQAAAEIQDTAATQQAAAVGQPTFRYDSFRFIYQGDFGKIVLVDQNPETGKAISQIPSQRALQLYAEQRRIEVQQSLSTNKGGGQVNTGSTGGRPLITSTATGAGTGTGTGSGKVSGQAAVTTTTTTTAPAPTPIPAAVPQAAFIAAAFSPVNITI